MKYGIMPDDTICRRSRAYMWIAISLLGIISFAILMKQNPPKRVVTVNATERR